MGNGAVRKQDKDSLSSSRQDLWDIQSTKFCKSKQRYATSNMEGLQEFVGQMTWESCLQAFCLCHLPVSSSHNAFAYFGGYFSILSCYYVPSLILPRTLSLIFLISSELLKILNDTVPATSQCSLVSGGEVKFNQKLLLMPSTCCLGLHIHPGSWMSLQPALDPTLACHTAGSDKRTCTVVTALGDTGGHRQYVTLNVFSCTYGTTILHY